jgi:hypothetical protein
LVTARLRTLSEPAEQIVALVLAEGLEHLQKRRLRYSSRSLRYRRSMIMVYGLKIGQAVPTGEESP